MGGVASIGRLCVFSIQHVITFMFRVADTVTDIPQSVTAPVVVVAPSTSPPTVNSAAAIDFTGEAQIKDAWNFSAPQFEIYILIFGSYTLILHNTNTIFAKLTLFQESTLQGVA